MNLKLASDKPCTFRQRPALTANEVERRSDWADHPADGLLDPEVEVQPVKGQIDHLLEECRQRAGRHERVLVTTLTKRMAEDLTEYFTEVGVRVRYLHSILNAGA